MLALWIWSKARRHSYAYQLSCPIVYLSDCGGVLRCKLTAVFGLTVRKPLMMLPLLSRSFCVFVFTLRVVTLRPSSLGGAGGGIASLRPSSLDGDGALQCKALNNTDRHRHTAVLIRRCRMLNCLNCVLPAIVTVCSSYQIRYAQRITPCKNVSLL